MVTSKKRKPNAKPKKSSQAIETKLRVDEATGHLKNGHCNNALFLYNQVSSSLDFWTYNLMENPVENPPGYTWNIWFIIFIVIKIYSLQLN